MSVLAGIDIFFNDKYSPLELIEVLIKGGWSYDDYGFISYLPLHDNDMFEWKTENLKKWSIVRNTIENKVLHGELVGICLVWKKTKRGGGFLFDSKDSSLNITLNINRKKCLHNDYDTDFDWYISKLSETFKKGNIDVKKIETSAI